MNNSLSACLPEHPDGVVIAVRVSPNASRSSIAGVLGEQLKLSIQAPPVDGKANKAVCAFLAKQLHLSKRSVSILSGETSRSKRVLVQGASCEDIAALLEPHLS